MTFSRSAAWIGGATLAAAWLASAAGVGRQGPVIQTPVRTPDAAQISTLAADVQAQANRLRQRLATAPSPQAPTRNPFTFAERRPPAARVHAAAAPHDEQETLAPALPTELPLALIGIAEQQTAAGLVRTALIAGPSDDDLHMLTAGQPLGDRYHVVAVSPDAVELRDLVTGAVRRLRLR